MIKISNGVNVLLVTNGAYKEQYKPLGWLPVKDKAAIVDLPDAAEKRAAQQAAEDKKRAEEEAKAKVVADIIGEEGEKVIAKEEEYVPEKPLAEMSNSELREKAKQLGVDISGLETRKQVRAAISAAMRG